MDDILIRNVLFDGKPVNVLVAGNRFRSRSIISFSETRLWGCGRRITRYPVFRRFSIIASPNRLKMLLGPQLGANRTVVS